MRHIVFLWGWIGWRPSLLGWRPLQLGWPLLFSSLLFSITLVLPGLSPGDIVRMALPHAALPSQFSCSTGLNAVSTPKVQVLAVLAASRLSGFGQLLRTPYCSFFFLFKPFHTFSYLFFLFVVLSFYQWQSFRKISEFFSTMKNHGF